jgi:ribonuclease E
MSKEIYISSTPHETRLAIVEKDELTEIYYERENEYTLAGSIYNGRVTRVLPGMQSSFVDIGLERDAFLYITDFMEEADGADFDGGDRAPRAERPRPEARAEGTAELGSEATRGEGGRSEGGRGEGGRSEASRGEGGRGEGRGRGRGRRDGRNRDRGGREREREAQPAVANVEERDELRPFEPSYAASDEEMLDVTPRESDGEEIGEGAPGADGGRRWRGRRGRRRGRGGNAAETSGTGEAVDGGSDGEVESAAEFAPRESAASREPIASRELIASRAEEESAPRAVAAGRERQRGDSDASRDRAPREGRRERGGRDRGRGGERGGRGERLEGSRQEAGRQESGRTDAGRHDAVRERFAPRGARPGSAHEEVIDLNAAASSPEPFILPGESLSKYRRGEEGAAGVSASAKPAGILVAAKASSEAAPIVGWDGGATLPGETLSRRREPSAEVRSESRSEARFENRGERGGDRNAERGGNRRRGRDEQRGRGGREERPRTETPRAFSAAPRGMDAAEATQPAVSTGHDVVEREYEPVYEPVHAMQNDALPVEAKLVEEFHEAITEFHETTTEYEPGEDASASYRVDPAGTSEFRQSGSVEEFDAVETEHGTADHEFTSVQAGGEMVSEAIAEDHAVASPTAPIAHESAVQSVPEHEAAMQAVPFEAHQDQQGFSPDQQGFSPGDGELEEELMDDDEAETVALHASAFNDEMEEETLEHAAGLDPDLGSMIRDISIDDITRPEPVEVDEDEDEDFEEGEDFEEDELESNGDEGEDEELSGSEISEGEEEEFSEATSYDENGDVIARSAASETRAAREGGREGRGRGRRDGRRGGRDRERSGSDRGSSERGSSEHGSERSTERSSGERSSGERSSGGHRDRRGMAGSRGGGRDRGGRSMQSTNLPAISDLLKPGQELLVQIAKEPIAKKGARITSHIALPGRFLVFMPTVGHTGVSRKIESDSERRRLKEILLSERGDATGGFIVRTAAAGASEEELRSDLRFLLNLWADIKARSESSKSPALIYHDLNLIERILRDQVTDNFSAIWVDTENEYERVLRFLQRFQPSLIRRVKLYTKETPLFEQFGITEEINKALRAKVWLKSGGSIVINQTEALVAIDINTGKYVGKTARLEDTILKTNLDAVPEIVRQIRLRDLGGIIIIDFIDMDERKNRNKVLAALEDELKKDRAPSKVLQFNDFGLVAITRKRVKQSLERTLSTTCGVCAGTGMVKSPVTVCNDIYIEMRKMHKLIEKGDIMLRVHPEVVKQLKTGSGKWLSEMEEMSGKTILIKSDPSLHPEQFDIH